MTQSSTKKASSRVAHADFPSSRPLHLTLGWSWLTPLARFWIAIVIVVAASVAAFMQSPRPDALRPPRWFTSMAWWRYPLEWNAVSRLPKIECSLKAIHAVPNSTSIWAVGNKGMVVNSADGGKTWIKKGIQTGQLTPAESPSPTGPTKSFLYWPDLIPTASAAQESSEQRPPPVQSGTPIPTGLEGKELFNRGSATPDPKAADFARQQGTPVPTPDASPSPIPSAYPSSTPTAFPQPSPEKEQLIAVYFADERRGEAVDSMGRQYVTSDGGNKWSQKLIDSRFFQEGVAQSLPPLRFIQLPSNDNPQRLYYAVNQSGNVFRIVDDGYRRIFPPEFGLLTRAYAEELNSVNTKAVHLLADGGSAWVVSTEGIVNRTRDGGALWEKLGTQSRDDLQGVYFINENQGWVVGSNGAIFATNDGGTTWAKQTSGTATQLNAVNFLSDGQQGWVAGNDGLILNTADGGATWVHRTQGLALYGGSYLRFPAPWYLLSLGLVGLLVWRRPKAPDEPPEESVADVLVSDRPLEEATGDVLAFNAIARGLSRFLRNENTLPPLTIAITGEWGTGKSSLMNLLRADLRSYKFRPVWFNAWHHQKEEHMLASLLENIKLQAVPRWWTTRGLLFRARLLRIRGVRQWLPVLLLGFFIYVVGVYYYYADRAFVDTIKIPLTPADVIEVLPILAGVITFVGAVWRGITAFGVKPASLLAGVSRGVSIRGLEAQTSFRQKFAVQFNDVTRALGARSLLIFIDDLDRCRPENVLETLEAVNFLTTSGECFVVIGMAREYVERCVGRAFNEVAQEMVDDLPKEAKESAEDIAKQKRIEFARQYLDKLVNIEVPVPAPKQSQSLALLVASTREAGLSKPASGWQQFKLSLLNFVEQRWRIVPALLVTGGLIVLGYYLARGLAGTTTTEPNSQLLVATTAPSQPSVAPSPLASPVGSAITSLSSTPAPAATPIPTPDTERPVVATGRRAIISSAVLPVIALLALIWLGSTILTRKPGLVVKDSPRFIAALEIWHPLVFARLCTPRATKRFMNFVRYLAMRQRRQSDSEPPIKQFLARVKEKLAGVRTTEEVIADVVNAESGVQQIPDEVMVALAALQHLNPECLTDQPGPVSSPDKVWPRAISAANPLRPLFDKAREDHEAKFGNWATLSQYRDRFLEMTANVQVR